MITKRKCPMCGYTTVARHCTGAMCPWLECSLCPVAKGKVIFDPFDSLRKFKVKG